MFWFTRVCFAVMTTADVLQPLLLKWSFLVNRVFVDVSLSVNHNC